MKKKFKMCSPPHVGAEYWLGLDNIYHLTNTKNYSLRVKLTDADGEKGVGMWNNFRLRNQVNNF
jgi:hypothetical protein